MSTTASESHLGDLRQALEERRNSWMKFSLHIWFNVPAECENVQSKLRNMQLRMKSEGHLDLTINEAVEQFVKNLVSKIKDHTTVLDSTQLPLPTYNGPARVLAQILSETFTGPYATIDDPRDGLIQLLHLTVRSESHKSVLASFSGEAAEKTLELMTRRNPDGSRPEPMRSLWLGHRSSMLRLLLKLARRSEVVPSTLFLTGIVCTQNDSPIAIGGNADIFRAELQGTPVVLKRLRVFQAVNEGRENVKKFCREALLWSQLSHPFVQVFLGVDKETFEGYYCMVNHWMENGDINKCMTTLTASGRTIPYDRWLLELCMGVEYLHQERIVHGDIRGNNVLIDGNLHIRITDFGLSAFAHPNTTSTGIVGGSTRWMAPELLTSSSQESPSFQSDVYAVGITCIEIYTQQQPYAELSNEAQVIQHVSKGERPRRPQGDPGRPMSFSLWVVVDSCWATNPSDRPHISDVVARVLSVTGVPSPATGITSTFEELIYDEESSVYRATRTTCSYAPYMPIVIVILIYVGLGLWAILDEEKIILFFPVFMSFFVQVVYARTVAGWVRRVTHWEVDERSFKEYCKHSILSGFAFLFLLFPVIVLTSR